MVKNKRLLEFCEHGIRECNRSIANARLSGTKELMAHFIGGKIAYQSVISELKDIESNSSGQDLKEMKLREYLWVNHGCSVGSLYGDDGEMQCSNCVIDFKNCSEDDLVKLLQGREV